MEAPKTIYLYEIFNENYGEPIVSKMWTGVKPAEQKSVKYLQKDAVVSTIKNYLENWLDAYRIERLIDKIEEL